MSGVRYPWDQGLLFVHIYVFMVWSKKILNKYLVIEWVKTEWFITTLGMQENNVIMAF